MVSQLEHWRQEALGIDGKERQVRRQLEKMLAIELPIGVGALSWITLELELRGWERFKNRVRSPALPASAPGSTSAIIGDAKAALTAAAIRWCATSLSRWSGDWCAGSLTIGLFRNCVAPPANEASVARWWPLLDAWT